MKLLSIKSVSAAMLISVLLLSACNDLTEGYSTDPVNVTDESQITTDKFLSGTEVSLIGVYEGDMNRLTGMWTGHFSGEDRQYVGLANYGVSGRDFNTEWAGVYSSVLKNVQIIKSRSHAENNTRMLAVAQVIEAMTVGLATDLWGDVPYTQTGQYPTITEPKFDDQLSLYADVQTLLDSAIHNFGIRVAKALKSRVSAADFYFGADSIAWTQVAHTLKARYYLHTRDYANAELHATQGIADPSGNMIAPHGGSYLQTFNLFGSFLTYDRPGYMGGNGYAAPLLDPSNPESRNNAKTDETARFNWLYIPAQWYTGGKYEENFYSVADGWLDAGQEAYDGAFGVSTDFPLVTFEENQLILAEARIKQGNFDDALAALNDLRAYYNAGGYWNSGYSDDDAPVYLPYDAADFDAGGIENADGSDPNDALLREILEERYITLTGQLEVYNDIRRTHNFLGIPVKAGNSTIPLRLLYPQSELNTNSNVPSSGVSLFEETTVNKTPY